MGSPTSVTTDNPEPPGKGGAGSKGTPAAATDKIDAAYSDERPSRDPWLSKAPTDRDADGGLGEMTFYYGACWLHHRSALRPEKMR